MDKFNWDKYHNYTLNDYLFDLEKIGLEKTWELICDYLLQFGENKFLLKISNFARLYEMGLAFNDKNLKKQNGQYYTPDDVANVMSLWFEQLGEKNVCDVACGTGKLILSYLDFIGRNKAEKIINSGSLYLYDFDKLALKICKISIIVKYKVKDFSLIHDIHADFLDSSIHLPQDSKVISNPPYAKITNILKSWEKTEVLIKTKEFYSAFMEKIFIESSSSVIITPFSFISSDKFYLLRQLMSDVGYGFIVSFDNVPGNIFWRKKYGVFNSNSTNSVRAAITVMKKDKNIHGFKVSNIIRFKNKERHILLNNSILENALSNDYQSIDKRHSKFKKIQKDLENLYNFWVLKSKYSLEDCLSKDKNNFFLDIPNTCRYFTVASSVKLNRVGSIQIYIKNEEMYNFVFCFLNSSFAYWWWRIYDGGISYTKKLLYSLPIPFNLLTEEDKNFFKSVRKEMEDVRSDFLIKKNNAGSLQENIKYPEFYKNIINSRILKILDCHIEESSFNKIHSNVFFDE
ncbi:MAG: N-6 DNA methylase [Metamycoplasmataceae bacterium]